MDVPRLRIGELSRRTGVSPALLRAWERRYGLLEPGRTEGGLRLYTDADERRVRAMRAGMGQGLSAAEAARAAREGAASTADPDPPRAGPGLAEAGSADLVAELRSAFDVMDAHLAHATLDRLLATFTLDTALAEVVLPFMRDLGERWLRGEATVAQEHFASNLIRGRLLSLARGWEGGGGPLAVLACAPQEQHDISLIAFGLALRGRGWRIAYLGPDTPVASLAEAAIAFRPALIAISAVTGGPFEEHAGELADLARTQPLAIAGAGASNELAARLGARWLEGDPISAAAAVAIMAT